MLCLRALLVLWLMIGGLTQAWATTGDEATARVKLLAYRYYYGKGYPVDYSRALAFYLLAAEQNDAEAQLVAGGMLFQGQGIEEPDKRTGFKWLLRAAEQGKSSPESLAIIGSMYLRGTDVPQNYLEAKKWLTGAAAQGSVDAYRDLAYLYYQGLGGDQDYVKALELYEKAALKGDVMAQANTGLMYASGTGTASDKARGYAWYSLSASRGNTTAAINRNRLMVDMSWDELNQAQAISLELYRQVERLAEPKPIVPEHRN